MKTIVSAVHLGGIVSFPRNYITTRLGMNSINSGWEFLRFKHAKHFGFGIEVRGAAPDFSHREELRLRAMEAVDMALARYGDMLIEADVRVREDSLGPEDLLLQGYMMDFNLPWDFSKPVLVQITWDSTGRSYRIMGVVYNHLIDGVPLALFMQLIHNHIILGEKSFLSQTNRSFPGSYRFHIDAGPAVLDRDQWLELDRTDEAALIPMGGQVDVSRSAIPSLRKKIMADTGVDISTSSLEITLLALETGMTWITDYIAQGRINKDRRLDVQHGYRGLGIFRMEAPEGIHGADPGAQYRWLCRVLAGGHEEARLEREARGRSSLFYDRYRRIAPFFLNFFDRRIGYDSVMAVAGTQIIGSNLNGVDYGVPLHVGGVQPENLRLIFIPSHGEHGEKTRKVRAWRRLETHVTEISLSCGPKVTESSGRAVLYKSLKVAAWKARELLAAWGYDGEAVRRLSPSEAVRRVFIETYNPAAPLDGRIERRARLYLEQQTARGAA